MSEQGTEQRIAGSAQLIKGSFTKYLAVSVLMVLSVTLGMFIDNVIAGNFLGADAVATIGISTPVFMLFAGAAGILSTGGSALAARALGRRDHKSVNALFTLVLLSACAVGLVLAVLLVLFSPQVAGMLGASEGLLAQNTAAYLSGLGFTALTSAVLQVMLSFTRVDNAPVIGLVSIVVMGISAACFDLIAILVFHAGMFGMGLATTAAYGLAFLVSTTHFFKKKNTLRLQNPLPHLHVIFLILKTGLPESLTRLTGMLRSFIFNNLLLMVAGSAAVAALSMLTSVNSFVSSVSIGAGQALMLLVAIYFGEENLSGIKGTFKVALRYGVVLCCIVGVATFVFAESIVSLFGITPDNEAFALGVVAVRAFSLSIPVELVNCLFVGFFQSTGNIKAANLVTVGQSCAFMILFALCTVWFIGPFGVWYSYLFGTCATLAAQVVAACVLWRRRKVAPGDEKASLLDKMLLLPADFRKDWVDSKEFSCVTDRRGVVQCSEEVDAWCKSHDIDPRRTFQLSLAVEEMVGNILDHGFAKVKHPAVEVFMVLKRDGSMILRIRDNGKAFNPLNYDMAAKDDFSCLGIRMIRLSIEHLEYQGMVGLNNLNIELKKPQAL